MNSKDIITTNEKLDFLQKSDSKPSDLMNIIVPAKVDNEGQEIIMVDTGSGFLRSNDTQLPDLKNIYDWIPPMVSCHNLNSGECFHYNTETQQKDLIARAQTQKCYDLPLLTTLKNIAVPAKINEEGEEI